MGSWHKLPRPFPTLNNVFLFVRENMILLLATICFFFVTSFSLAPISAQESAELPVFSIDTILRVQFSPTEPAFVEVMHKEQDKIQGKGPFEYEPLRGERVDDILTNYDLEIYAEEIDRLNPRAEVAPTDILLAAAFSSILREQTRAYAKFPWLREERITFAHAVLQDLHFKLPMHSSRHYFLVQQLSNMLGLRINWLKATELIQIDVQNRLRNSRGALGTRLVISADEVGLNRDFALNLLYETELRDGLFTPANFGWTSFILIKLFDEARRQLGVESAGKVITNYLKAIGMKLDSFDAESAEKEYERHLIRGFQDLNWDYRSEGVYLPANIKPESHGLSIATEGGLIGSLKRLWKLSKSLDEREQFHEALWFFSIAQISGRAGLEVNLRNSNTSVSKLKRETWIVEIQTPKTEDRLIQNGDHWQVHGGQAAGPIHRIDLMSYWPENEFPLLLQLLEAMEAALDANFSGSEREIYAELLRRKVGEQLSLDPETKIKGDELANLFKYVEPFLSDRDSLYIDWSYGTAELFNYKPLIGERGIRVRLSRPELGRMGLIVSSMKDLEAYLDRLHRDLPHQQFESSYAYIAMSGGFTVDFDSARYGSRAWEVAEDLRPNLRLNRAPMAWPNVRFNWAYGEAPTSVEELKDQVFDKLNHIYIQKIFSKILSMYGFDFSHDFTLARQRASSPHFQDDVIPYYESVKLDRYYRHDFEVMRVRIPTPEIYNKDQLKEYYQMSFLDILERISEEALAVAYDEYERTESAQAGREAMREALSGELRSFYLMELAENITNNLGMADQSPYYEMLDRFSGTWLKKNSRGEWVDNFSDQLASRLEGRQLGAVSGLIKEYRASVIQDRLMFFPVTMTVEEDDEGRPQLYLFLVNGMWQEEEFGPYDDEVQVDVTKEVIAQANAEATVNLVREILDVSIGTPNFESTWTGGATSKDELLDRINTKNVSMIIKMAADIEHVRINRLELWKKRKFLPRQQYVNDGPAIGLPGFGSQ